MEWTFGQWAPYSKQAPQVNHIHFFLYWLLQTQPQLLSCPWEMSDVSLPPATSECSICRQVAQGLSSPSCRSKVVLPPAKSGERAICKKKTILSIYLAFSGDFKNLLREINQKQQQRAVELSYSHQHLHRADLNSPVKVLKTELSFILFNVVLGLEPKALSMLGRLFYFSCQSGKIHWQKKTIRKDLCLALIWGNRPAIVVELEVLYLLTGPQTRPPQSQYLIQTH